MKQLVLAGPVLGLQGPERGRVAARQRQEQRAFPAAGGPRHREERPGDEEPEDQQSTQDPACLHGVLLVGGSSEASPPCGYISQVRGGSPALTRGRWGVVCGESVAECVVRFCKGAFRASRKSGFRRSARFARSSRRCRRAPRRRFPLGSSRRFAPRRLASNCSSTPPICMVSWRAGSAPISKNCETSRIKSGAF